MIHVVCNDNSKARRVECSLVIDGREYARLRAIADTMNKWGRLSLLNEMRTDNTPATVYEEFYFFLGDLDGRASDCADCVFDGLGYYEGLKGDDGIMYGAFRDALRNVSERADAAFTSGGEQAKR